MRDSLVVAAVLLVMHGSPVAALEIETGIGAGMEYTDNVALTQGNEVSDQISASYVGARIEDNTGSLHFNATTALSYHDYKEPVYADERYFTLGATALWEMIKNRFDWQIKDYYTQQSVVSSDPGVASNLQDTNVFTIAPNILLPLSGRQTLIVTPEYQKYYYEVLTTDNRQSSLMANWLYSMNRTTEIGLIVGVREIDYDQEGIADNTISQSHVTVSGKRVRAEYSIHLGATRVDRDNGSSIDGMTGSIDWSSTLTAHSDFRLFLSSDLTDTSSSLLRLTIDPDTGDVANVQVATDAIRNRVLTLTYKREDASLKSRLWTELLELDYTLSPNDRSVKGLGMEFSYPLTAMLTGDLYTRYNNTRLTDTFSENSQSTVGGTLTYRFTRKLRALFDVQSRTRNSTLSNGDYDNLRVYLSLVYGYGGLQRPG